jgi:drug/metabolite transporter (DMT)-like permease
MWLPLSLFYALFDSLQNAYYKKVSLEISPVLLAWSVLLVSGLLFSPLLFLGVPHLNQAFWFSVILRLFVDSLAFTLFITGVQKSPLSLTIPMLSLSPILSIATVFFINRLAPSPLGLIGVIVTVSGLYLLNFNHDTKDVLSPFKSVFKEKGVLYVSAAAILWSLVSSLQKLAIDNSNVYFYTSFFQLLWAVCFTPVAYFVDKKGFVSLFQLKFMKKLFTAGFLDALKTIFQNLAYVLTIPPYVNSVGSTSILFASFFGWFFFKEKVEKHVVPIIFVFMGIILITLAHK